MTRMLRVMTIPVILSLGGCGDLFGPDVDGRLRGLDGQIIFLIREIHGFEFDVVGEPQMALYLLTDRTYPCRGYTIEGDVGVAGSVITVRLDGIREPALCFEQSQPAEGRQVLDVGPGTWTLRFTHEDRASEYTLTIDDEAIAVAGDESGLAVPDFPLFWRYPVDSFALACDRAGGYPDICAELNDSVAATPGVAPFEFGAEGGIPYPVSFANSQVSWLVTYFTYADPEAWDSARTRGAAVFSRFQGMRYYLVDWRNEHAGSWP